MRKSFHHQLAKLRGKEPFVDLDSPAYNAATKEFKGQRFTPFYGDYVRVQAAVDITLLTGLPAKKSVVSSGDLDNRLKRIIDALRMPQQAQEVLDEPIAADRCFCLLQDDSSVSRVTAQLGPYLAGDDETSSFAFVRVRATPIAVTPDNISMLF